MTEEKHLLFGMNDDGQYVPLSSHGSRQEAEDAAQCMQRGAQILGPVAACVPVPCEETERELIQLRLFKRQFCRAFHIADDADFQTEILNAPRAFAVELQRWRDGSGVPLTRADIDMIERWYFAQKDRCDGVHDTGDDDTLIERLRKGVQ